MHISGVFPIQTPCYGAIRETTVPLLTDGRMCVFLHTFGEESVLPGGREAEFGEEEEVESCEERSVEAQLVGPPV